MVRGDVARVDNTLSPFPGFLEVPVALHPLRDGDRHLVHTGSPHRKTSFREVTLIRREKACAGVLTRIERDFHNFPAINPVEFCEVRFVEVSGNYASSDGVGERGTWCRDCEANLPDLGSRYSVMSFECDSQN